MTHLKLGKWRLTGAEVPAPAGTGDGICPKETPFLQPNILILIQELNKTHL